MRPIDADLFEVMTLENVSVGFAEGVQYMLKRIDAAPTIKVRAEVHGQWVHDGPRIKGGVDWHHCSACGRKESGVYARAHFCPWCGARMDKEV